MSYKIWAYDQSAKATLRPPTILQFIFLQLSRLKLVSRWDFSLTPTKESKKYDTVMQRYIRSNILKKNNTS